MLRCDRLTGFLISIMSQVDHLRCFAIFISFINACGCTLTVPPEGHSCGRTIAGIRIRILPDLCGIKSRGGLQHFCDVAAVMTEGSIITIAAPCIVVMRFVIGKICRCDHIAIANGALHEDIVIFVVVCIVSRKILCFNRPGIQSPCFGFLFYDQIAIRYNRISIRGADTAIELQLFQNLIRTRPILRIILVIPVKGGFEVQLFLKSNDLNAASVRACACYIAVRCHREHPVLYRLAVLVHRRKLFVVILVVCLRR